MFSRYIYLAVLLALSFDYSSNAFAAGHAPRSCGASHDSFTIPPGGIGGTGHEATIPPGGMGGTGHEATIPPGGMGGTGITAANMTTVHGVVVAKDLNNQIIQLAVGDAICVGDRITSGENGKAKMQFTDGATLYVLKNTDIHIDDYYYSIAAPEEGRSLITLEQGDIRSVSGAISKDNPKDYRFQTPAATIRVIGTDFLITHLTEQNGELDAGTYTKVNTGEVSVQSASGVIRLHAGQSSHVTLNGSQSTGSSSSGSSSSNGCSVR